MTAPFAMMAASRATGAAAQDAPKLPSGAFVIRCGAALLEKNNELAVEHGVDVLVRDGVIEDIKVDPISGFPVVDASRHLVLPSFISGHTHCCSGTPTRGIFEAGRSYRDPLQLVEKLSDEEQDALTALNMAELLRSGCTTHIEMSLTLRQAESYVRVAKPWGVRGFPGHMIPNTTRLFEIWFRTDDKVLFESENETLREIADGLAFGKTHMGANGGLIVPMMNAHATDTHTEKTMRALKAACDELGSGLHLHYSQSGGESGKVKALWGKSPTEWLDSFGLLDQPVFGAHMSGIDWAAEGPMLKAKGVVYAHCPSGGGAGGGSQPYPEALAAGVASNIGIDTHSNDYVEDLKLAVLYGKNRTRHLRRTSAVPLKSPTIMDALDGATRVPADALKRPDLGRIKIGAQADIVTVDVSGMLSGSGAMPPEPVYNLLYCNGMMVRHVMTTGRIQVYDGALVVAGEAKVIADGGAVVQKIWAQLEDAGWFSAPIPRRG
ncbi:MAG: amidohydrolase family protein [Rhodobacteraceae bacterium]|nr:amidohydrolase family protein [Paracoccaceae bacterium]